MKRFIDEIAVTVLLFLFLLVAGGVLFWRVQEQENRKDCEAALQLLAQEKADDLRRWRHERLTDARVWSAGPYLASAIADFLRTKQDEIGRRLLDFFSHFTAYGYSDVIVADADGNIVLSLKKTHADIHAPAHLACEEARRSSAAYATLIDWHADHAGKISPHLAAMSTVIDPQSSSLAGFVFLVTEFDQAEKILVARHRYRQTMKIHLVRCDGDRALFISAVETAGGKTLHYSEPLVKANSTAVMAVKGHRGVVEGVDEAGVEVISAIAPVPDSPWFLICQQSKAEALAPYRRHSALIFISLASLLAAGVATAGMFLQRRQKKLAQACAEASQMAQQAQAERLRVCEQARSILMSIGDAVIVADSEGALEMMNSVAESLTGWTMSCLLYTSPSPRDS